MLVDLDMAELPGLELDLDSCLVRLELGLDQTLQALEAGSREREVAQGNDHADSTRKVGS